MTQKAKSLGAVYFYHLTRQTVDQALLPLLDKSLQAGWRVNIRGTQPDRMAWLDEKLWQGPDDGFLPHGLAGGEHDAEQPILLSHEGQHSCDCLMAVDGAEVSVDEVQSSSRTCILFDGADESQLSKARLQWAALTDAGCAAQYWSQADGRWALKAQKNTDD